jgi:hypothetical protein
MPTALQLPQQHTLLDVIQRQQPVATTQFSPLLQRVFVTGVHLRELHGQMFSLLVVVAALVLIQAVVVLVVEFPIKLGHQ